MNLAVQKIPKAVALCDAAEHGHVDCLEILHGFGISLDEQKVKKDLCFRDLMDTFF